MITADQVTTIFCVVDEFMIEFNHSILNHLIGNPPKRKPTMNSSEVITIQILFQLSGVRSIKWRAMFQMVLYKLCSKTFKK